ncbi:MAG: 50S ribosomal protein L25 [Parcubacteria group bacterium CG10_big_fil_rev_8_21_14_0_10_36_14]|nr:MAG: 50S ribosomal protein L25 [Parcubacteria group bacterium CG10_big_fil_rev_8_21_14_0_10_36_14]
MTVILNSEARGEKTISALRAEGKITAELYGPEIKNQSVLLDYKEFDKVYNEAGESSLVVVKAPDGTDINVLIVEVQYHPISGKYINVDLRQVSMKEKIEADVELKFIGEAPAVKGLGGTFIPAKNTLAIKALPADLISEIEVDISGLATFEDKITVADIKLAPGIEIMDSPESLVAIITEPQEEEVAEPTPESEAERVASVEVAGEKKEDSDEEKEDSKN